MTTFDDLSKLTVGCSSSLDSTLSELTASRLPIESAALARFSTPRNSFDSALTGLTASGPSIDSIVAGFPMLRTSLDDTLMGHTVSRLPVESAALAGFTTPRNSFDTVLTGLTASRPSSDSILAGFSTSRTSLDATLAGLTASRLPIESPALAGFITPGNSLDRTLAGLPISSPSISNTLTDINTRLSADYDTWTKIDRSFDSLREAKSNALPVPIATPDFVSGFERALETRAKRDRKIHDQQFDLLGSIADAGKKQNEIMMGITKLQELLVQEAIHNSKVQRIVLYFAALSAALALFALFK